MQARKRKSPPCFWEREDVTPGAMLRQGKDLLAVERVQARKEKVLSASGGGGDVHPGQVEAPFKVLITVERVKAI